MFKNSLTLVSALILGLNLGAAPARADGGNLLGGVVVGAILYCGLSGNCTGNGNRPQGGDAVAMDQDQRMMVQEGLAYHGFYDGAIDGAIGPGSRQAIAAYQKSIGAEETGYLSATQITDLMRDSQNYRHVPDNDDRLFALELGDTLEGDDVRVLQASLNDMGYDAGTPDGLLGRNTRQAIAAYKNDQGYAGPPVATELLLARITNSELPTASNLSAMNSSDFSLLGEYETMEPTELNCETAPMRITPTEMWGYESVCYFPQALSATQTEVSANMVCNGEGETFASLRDLRLDGANLVVTYENASTFTYRRCGADLQETSLTGDTVSEGPLNFTPPSRAVGNWLMASEIGTSMFSRPTRSALHAFLKNGMPENATVGKAIAAETQCIRSRVASVAPDQTDTDSSITFIAAKPATASRASKSRPC